MKNQAIIHEIDTSLNNSSHFKVKTRLGSIGGQMNQTFFVQTTKNNISNDYANDNQSMVNYLNTTDYNTATAARNIVASKNQFFELRNKTSKASAQRRRNLSSIIQPGVSVPRDSDQVGNQSFINTSRISPLNRTFNKVTTLEPEKKTKYLYEDTSIDSHVKKQERRIRSLIRMKEHEENKLYQIHSQQRKSQMARLYYEVYGSKLILSQIINKVHVNERDVMFMSEIELEMSLKRRLLKRKMTQMAIKIQSYYRMRLCRQQFVKYLEMRNKAANRLQQFWKRYHMWQLIPQALLHRKTQAAIRVQKYLKSFIAHKKIFQQLTQFKFDTCFSYFSELRVKIVENAQILIAYHWRKYKKNKAMKPKNKNVKKVNKFGRQITKREERNVPPKKQITSTGVNANNTLNRENSPSKQQLIQNSKPSDGQVSLNKVNTQTNNAKRSPQMNPSLNSIIKKADFQKTIGIQKQNTGDKKPIQNLNLGAIAQVAQKIVQFKSQVGSSTNRTNKDSNGSGIQTKLQEIVNQAQELDQLNYSINEEEKEQKEHQINTNPTPPSDSTLINRRSSHHFQSELNQQNTRKPEIVLNIDSNHDIILQQQEQESETMSNESTKNQEEILEKELQEENQENSSISENENENNFEMNESKNDKSQFNDRNSNDNLNLQNSLKSQKQEIRSQNRSQSNHAHELQLHEQSSKTSSKRSISGAKANINSQDKMSKSPPINSLKQIASNKTNGGNKSYLEQRH
ncbi:UNKNOWN [Stylonychia lemnae]|uniref:Uncharacterized protein n=1 Tax=Stylonychia lemnae TaxID=5949 RepID=A0A078AB86_STYLE|nr:UNKNOWN [Stylonychia lemnae]|eukprot:CDW79419.1 UNKNOWN [Stylonychia lemnae]